jgi:serine/threonine-protein phosphatase 2A activator
MCGAVHKFVVCANFHYQGFIFLIITLGHFHLSEDVSLKPTSILYPPLPLTNLYNLSIMRIHALKRGPFHEHSPQLYSIAVGVQGWRKVNSGMLKMYEAEVLAKRVVVQHIPLGGLISWDVADGDEAEPNGALEQAEAGRKVRRSKGPSNAVRGVPQLPTQTPWASPGSFSMPPPTRRPT